MSSTKLEKALQILSVIFVSVGSIFAVTGLVPETVIDEIASGTLALAGAIGNLVYYVKGKKES